MNSPPAVVLLLAGAFLWTLGEYVMHRFVMHEMRGRGMASREHLRHHAERDSILEKWVLAWTGIVAVGVFVLRPLGGWPLGLGWIAGYGFYDLMHWRAHRRAPRNPYARWLRRHHFHHHFHAPMRNHGVTTPVWDLLFGTYERPTVVRVPRRLAMVWLVDDDGACRAEYAGDYAVVAPQIPQMRCSPPSTVSTSPVMYDAAGESRNTVAAATSHAVP